MNKVILKGRLVREPENVDNKSGKTLCKVSIAVNRKYKREEADFFNCVAWEKLADHILKYFEKGSEILVEGRIEIDKYVDQEGKNQQRTTIRIEEAHFCGKKSDNVNTGNDNPVRTTNKTENTKSTNNKLPARNAPEIPDEELPF